VRAILTYHSVDDSGSPVSVSPETFRRHVRWLASGRLRVVTVPELLRVPDDADAVALTFDDGLRSFGDVAAPLLAEHGLPATLFVVSDRAGATSAWPDAATRRGPKAPTFPLLDWPTLRRLAERGGVELGAHTRTHRDLTRLRGAELADEVDGCAARIVEETGRRPDAFAYPYGAYDADAVAAVARSYAWACTTDLRALAPADRPHLLPRLDAYYLRAPGALESWGSAAFRRRLWLRAGARRVRRTLTSALGAA
jgi:peptidoglycan/xylan/chitin deacetylase (PgdA/CDA1 family)